MAVLIAVLASASAASARPALPEQAVQVWLPGLKPDGWGTTVAIGSSALRKRFPGILRVSCEGVQMIGHKARSSWRARGLRFWDKLYCSGVAGSKASFFTLVYDPAKPRWRVRRLQNLTLAELSTKTAPAPAPSQPPPSTTPPPPSTTPTPPPADQATTLLLEQAVQEMIRIGQSYSGLTDSTGFYYHWQGFRNECVRLSGDTGRCYLYLWKQVQTQDQNFNVYISRYLYRVGVFAVDLGRGAYHTYSNQADYVDPWQLVCTNVPSASGPRCP